MFVLSILYVWNKIISYRPFSFETCYFLSTTIKLLWWQLLCWDIIVVDINIHYSLFILWILHVFTTVPSAVKYIKIEEALCELLLKKKEKNARPSPRRVLIRPSLSSPAGDYNQHFGARRGNQAQQGSIDAAHRRGSNQRVQYNDGSWVYKLVGVAFGRRGGTKLNDSFRRASSQRG